MEQRGMKRCGVCGHRIEREGRERRRRIWGVEEEEVEVEDNRNQLKQTLLISFGLLLLFSSIPFLSLKVISEQERMKQLVKERGYPFKQHHTQYYMYLSFLVTVPFLVIIVCYVCSHPFVNQSTEEREVTRRRRWIVSSSTPSMV